MKIQYLKGDATVPVSPQGAYIAHCCNNANGFGRGFAHATRSRYPLVKERYHKWFDGETGPNMTGPPTLGNVQFVPLDGDVTYCNIVGQDGYSGKPQGYVYVRYDAIETGLRHIRERIERDRARGVTKPLQMPRMGSGLAGGKWERIEGFINDIFGHTETEVFVVDIE